MRIAITRDVSPAIAHCELTHIKREPINIKTMRAQHRSYEECLKDIGCKVIRLPAELEFPDSMFVEDTAIVLDEIAVITRPGAASRRGETSSIATALSSYRKLFHIEAPGTIDGGDVLRIGKTLYIGMSGRSNPEGSAQMQRVVSLFGYQVVNVEVTGCLHLKSAITQASKDSVLINPAWVDGKYFKDVRFVEVDISEPEGANGLFENGSLLYSSSFPKTRKKLIAEGMSLRTLDVSEIAKAEGALTCCSLIFNDIRS